MKEGTDAKSLSRQRYARYAEGYVTSETHARGSDLDRLLALASPESHWRALDIATGGGHTALKLAPHVAHVVASDLTPRMLEKARQFIVDERGISNVSFERADAEDLPFGDGEYDLATCRIAPHHFPDVPRFLRECRRVLQPGGVFVLQDHLLPDDAEAARFVDSFERLRDPSHHRAFALDEWTAMIRQGGMRVEASERYVKRHDFVPWARRQGADEALIARLIMMVDEAPPLAREWMDPRDWGKPNATFVNRHILIRARTASA